MSFPEYPNYKGSGDAFLGEIPTHWTVKRLRSIADVKNGFPFDSALFDEILGHQLIRIRDLNCSDTATKFNGPFIDSASVTEADVLIGMDGDFNVGKWRGNAPALLNQRMCCVRTKDKVLSNFIFHFLPLPLKAINDVTYSTTVKHLSSFQVEKMCLALPENAEELSIIVSFLDSETAKIDALIHEQTRLVKLLSEKRQSVISNAVKRGLNPNVRMEKSVVQWLGSTPSHWEVHSLKRAFISIEYGISESLGPDGAVAILRMGNIQNGAVELGELKYVDDVSADLLLEDGDLLYNRTNSLDQVGKVGMFKKQDGLDRVSFASYLVRLRTTATCNPKYFSYLLNDDGFLRLVRSMAFEAIGQCNLNPTRYGEIPVPFPPLTEQVEIVNHLDRATSEIDLLIQEAVSATTLLGERRSALISAAVTGKIDVRGFVAPTAQ